jgi:hypothetical protein
MPDWDGTDFDFDEDKLVDDSIYRIVEVGDFDEDTDDRFNVTVTSYITRNDEYLAQSVLKINLVDATTE